MQKRKLGNQGLEVSEIGMGCMTMTGGTYTTFASTDLRSRIPRFEPQLRTANVPLVDLLGKIAARKGRAIA